MTEEDAGTAKAVEKKKKKENRILWAGSGGEKSGGGEPPSGPETQGISFAVSGLDRRRTVGSAGGAR